MQPTRDAGTVISNGDDLELGRQGGGEAKGGEGSPKCFTEKSPLAYRKLGPPLLVRGVGAIASKINTKHLLTKTYLNMKRLIITNEMGKKTLWESNQTTLHGVLQ